MMFAAVSTVCYLGAFGAFMWDSNTADITGLILALIATAALFEAVTHG